MIGQQAGMMGEIESKAIPADFNTTVWRGKTLRYF